MQQDTFEKFKIMADYQQSISRLYWDQALKMYIAIILRAGKLNLGKGNNITCFLCCYFLNPGDKSHTYRAKKPVALLFNALDCVW